MEKNKFVAYDTMFQNLASYFFNSFQGGDPTAERIEEDSSIKLKATEENEWILVDRDSEGNSETSSVKSLCYEDYDIATAPMIPLHSIPLTRSSSTSSLPNTYNMEESWFVTPPPCFTSTGPVVMRTSPLENLLIEHPSMSVYHIHPRRHFSVRSVRSTSSASRGSLEDLEVEEVRDNIREEQLAVEIRSPRLNRLQTLRQQEKQYLMSRNAQKVQLQKNCKSFNRGNLQRYNKAREVNGRNQRQRRGERSQGATRSHANNNRKC